MAEQTLFIGRERMLERLAKEVFVTTPRYGTCYSIIGPNDVGKTTLVRKARQIFMEKEHPHVFCFTTSVQNRGENCFWKFWGDVVADISDTITEEVMLSAPNPDPFYIKKLLQAYEFFTEGDMLEQMGTRAFDVKARRHLDRLFPALTELGLHVILVIDEFDNARTAYPKENKDGSFFQHLFSLTKKGSNLLNLSILLLHRRRAATIAHHMADGSDFEAAFPPITLRGFNDRELDAYFESYASLGCGVPNAQQRQGIIYFCGRHPGLLMKMRRLTEASGCTMENFNPAAIYASGGLEMRVVYERMCTLMRTEFVDSERKVNCIGTFAQAFIGPAYDPNLGARLAQLQHYGFVTELGRSDSADEPMAQDVFTLAGCPVSSQGDQPGRYDPLSAYFVAFIKHQILPEELDGLSRLLGQTEISVRQMILHALKTNYPGQWEQILDTKTSDLKDSFHANLQAQAVANDAASRNISFTQLDVMAFYEYGRFVRDYWEDIAPYFTSYRNAQEVNEDFEFLHSARDCFAHNNAKLLNERNCAKLREICSRVSQDIQNGYEGKTTETEDGPTGPRTIAELQPGMYLDGKVCQVRPFGAFVDIGVGQNGLVHKSQIKNGYVSNVADELSVGQQVTVKVLEVDTADKKISLTMKGVRQNNA